MNGDIPLEEEMETAARGKQFDRALDLLEVIEARRTLTASELVQKARWMMLSDGRPGRRPQDASQLLRAVLERDAHNFAALTELGWYHYAVENDAGSARPYFEQALEAVKSDLQDSIEGLLNCIRETEGDNAVDRYLEEIMQQLVDIGKIRTRLLPVDTDDGV